MFYYEWGVDAKNAMIRAYYAKDVKFVPHLHREMEFIFVTEGSLDVTVNNCTRNLKAGEMCLIPGSHVHSYWNPEPNRAYLVVFDPHCFPDFYKHFRKRRIVTGFLPSAGKDEVYIECFRHIVEELKPDGSELIGYGYTNVLLGELLKHLRFTEDRDSGATQGLLQEAFAVLEEHFDEDISLSWLAEKLGTSQFYLSKLFNKKIGCGFNQYLKLLRIQKAERLLRGDKSVLEIAYECGFNNMRTFHRAFKEVHNMPPREWRRQKSIH